MYWFWMNVPLAAAFFAAWTAIPLWLVLKHPDTGPQPRTAEAPPRCEDTPATPAGREQQPPAASAVLSPQAYAADL
jgi:hypothetical protein